MHKKLEAELTSLAHSILQMKNKDDVFALQKKAHEVYEKLSVLAYVEEYINNTPNPEHTKEELVTLIEEAEKKVEVLSEIETQEEETVEEEVKEEIDEVIENTIEEVTESESSESEEEVVKYDLEESAETEEEPEIEEVVNEEPEQVEESVEEVKEEETEAEDEKEEVLELELEASEDLLNTEEKKAPSLDEELQDTMPVDVVADLFESAPKKSLNDKLQGDIQIGLNDRIAFVKHLFDGSQEDFNRVVSQLNTFKTEKEAKKFLNKMVKPDYDWNEKEEFEDRFMAIVERKFA